ncbi:hypothetical protein JCM14244_17130 [Venenivibrio stagnispumantis]|uniref:Uncharacterized protein n=1 Tax=Venenivibrio stagnispumantis TaxID=407998 RepID=A0AA46AFW2_9AQUI|nr:hypothetical protein [Venenivibrio stagnispumantis]MCW4573966.1 hypothetical protein [Venenivibrio stagnispumantis]SMP22417.1 hypothetical protein SAMN06264868_1262 [Venenivibrio stagnispumantis]
MLLVKIDVKGYKEDKTRELNYYSNGAFFCFREDTRENPLYFKKIELEKIPVRNIGELTFGNTEWKGLIQIREYFLDFDNDKRDFEIELYHNDRLNSEIYSEILELIFGTLNRLKEQGRVDNYIIQS